jgi:hypothetical protein
VRVACVVPRYWELNLVTLSYIGFGVRPLDRIGQRFQGVLSCLVMAMDGGTGEDGRRRRICKCQAEERYMSE